MTITNAVSDTTAILSILAAVATNQLYMSGRATGDATARIVLGTDSSGNPEIRFGPGSGGTDTFIYRTGAAALASDPIAANVGGTGETQHSVTFANSWAQNAARASTLYQLVASPANEFEIVGSVTVPVGFAANQNVTTAAPAAYRPVSAQSITGWDLTNDLPVRFNWLATGALQFHGPVANTAAGHNIDIPVQRVNLVA
jgi:hypothetical protein